MEALKKYGSKFLIGAAIGVAVWAGMAGLGAMGAVTFTLESGLVGATLGNPVYTGLFFGLIQAASAAIPDLISPLIKRFSGKGDAEPNHAKDQDAHCKTKTCAKAQHCSKEHAVSGIEYSGRMQPEPQREIV